MPKFARCRKTRCREASYRKASYRKASYRKDYLLRVIFMGSPDFAVGTLQVLMEVGHEVVCVYAQPPRPRGRGHREQPCPVHTEATSRGLMVRTPASMREPSAIAGFADLKAHIAVVVAYGQILPVDVLEAPEYGCINVHASLLPRWRGAAPVQRAIQAGDRESGVSIMQIAAGLDTGPVYLSRSVRLDAHTTGGGLHDELAAMGAVACTDVLRAIEDGTAVARQQATTGVSYAGKLHTAESRLDWSGDATALERTIRAFNPWPHTWFDHGGERIGVLAAHVSREHPSGKSGTTMPGTIIDTRPAIACGSGVLVLDRLQRAGRKPQDATAFMRGYDMKAGTCLGSV